MPTARQGQYGDIAMAEDFEGGSKDVGAGGHVPLLCTQNTTGILIRADHGNGTAFIYVGKSDVQNDGTNAIDKLEAGQAISYAYNDTGTHFCVIGSANGLKVWYTFLIRGAWG